MRTTLFFLALLVSTAASFCLYSTRQRHSLSTSASSSCLRQSSSAWQSQVSTDSDASLALNTLLNNLKTNNDEKTASPDVAFLFVSAAHASEFPDLVQTAWQQLQSSNDKKQCRLLSVVGGGVIGDQMEMDEPTKPGVALLTGKLPEGTDIEVFSFNELTNPPPPPDDAYWRSSSSSRSSQFLATTSSSSSSDKSDTSSAILFVDPWSPMERLMKSLSQKQNSVVVGGISVPTGTGPTIGMDDQALPQGSCVGLRLTGGSLGIQAVVAQGCQPVGPPFTITAQEGNVITELNSQPALKTLEEVANTASPEEQQKISSGLVCGVAGVDQEDYLIRQIMGFVPAKQGIAIGSKVQVGDRFRFHVRDKAAAEEDLQLMIQRAKTERLFFGSSYSSSSGSDQQTNPPRAVGKPVAALQISCIARGRSLFGNPNVDLNKIQELLDDDDDDAAVGGFYANGEIGPVGIAGFSSTNKNTETYLHGFTTVAAIFCDYSGSSGDDSTSEAVQCTSTQTATMQDDETVDAWG